MLPSQIPPSALTPASRHARPESPAECHIFGAFAPAGIQLRPESVPIHNLPCCRVSTPIPGCRSDHPPACKLPSDPRRPSAAVRGQQPPSISSLRGRQTDLAPQRAKARCARYEAPMIVLPQSDRRALSSEDSSLRILSQQGIWLGGRLPGQIAHIGAASIRRQSPQCADCFATRYFRCARPSWSATALQEDRAPCACVWCGRPSAGTVPFAAVPERTVWTIENAPDKCALQVQWFRNPLILVALAQHHSPAARNRHDLISFVRSKCSPGRMGELIQWERKFEVRKLPVFAHEVNPRRGSHPKRAVWSKYKLSMIRSGIPWSAPYLWNWLPS